MLTAGPLASVRIPFSEAMSMPALQSSVASRAETLLQVGNWPAARALLEQSARSPDAPAADLRLLAKLLLSCNEAAAAVAMMERALAAAPHTAEMDFEMGVMLLALGRDVPAEQAFRRELKRTPEHGGALYNLAFCLDRQDRGDEAQAVYQAVVRAHPNRADAWFNLANGYMRQGRSAEALAAYEQALAIRPDDPGCNLNLALCLGSLGRLEEAVERLSAALKRVPDQADLLAALGNVLSRLGRDHDAVEHLAKAVRLAPGDIDKLVNLGLALRRCGRSAEARSILLPWAQKTPSAALQNCLGLTFLDDRQLVAASTVFETALRSWPDNVELLNNLGNVYSGLGRLDDAMTQYGLAHAADPTSAAAHSNLLFALTHSNHDLQDIYAEHLRYGEIQEAAAEPLELAAPLARDGRRLRIGLLSPDFCDHAVTYFLRPVLEQLDRSRLEVFCYACGPRRDAVTAQLRLLADHWRDVDALPPDAAARVIQADNVDILVDLAGHSAGNGLPIMARKPAHLQVTWLGYPNTTGMTRVDYRLGLGGDPPGEAVPFNTELGIRLLDHPVFTAPTVDVDVVPPPAATRGYVTFGCVNKFIKVSDQCLTAWGRILQRLPGSRLMIVLDEAEDIDRSETLKRRLVNAGLAPEQIDVVEKMPLADFLATLNQIDIALDPFPFGGGSTTLFTLWMGVPVISLTQDEATQRSMTTPAYLGAADLSDLIATDMDDYVRKAVALAKDAPMRADLRATLRARVLVSPLMRPQLLARRLETVFAALWDHHVARWGEASEAQRQGRLP